MKPVILITPYHRLFHEKFPSEISETKEEYYEFLIAEKLCKSILVIDKFCCDISYDDKYWADMTHLNSAGAEIFSMQLEKEFRESYY